MKVLLTGATGLVGASVLQSLLGAGHDVVAVVRSNEAAAKVDAAGATAVVHPLPDTDWLADRLREVDAAIHTATTDDGSAPAFDDSVIDAVIAAFAGTDKRYIHTGGFWVRGQGDDLTEDDPRDAPAITAWREERETRLLASGVAANVIEPGIVYGNGQGIVTVLVGGPRDADGALHLIGSGEQHWTTVHTADLGDLYLLVLEKAPAGEVYAGVSGQNPSVRELGEAIVGPDGTVVPESDEATRERLGAPFADALLANQRSAGAKSRALGWIPSRPSLVEELRAR